MYKETNQSKVVNGVDEFSLTGLKTVVFKYGLFNFNDIISEKMQL